MHQNHWRLGASLQTPLDEFTTFYTYIVGEDVDEERDEFASNLNFLTSLHHYGEFESHQKLLFKI